MAKKIVLSMGHRNLTRGGAAGEIDWTDDMVRDLAAEFRARGAEVYIVQEYDGDGDPNFTYQGLGAIGGIVEAIDQKHGPVDAYLSIHYEGGPVRGFFAIASDAGGLRSGATGQPVTHDSWESNPLDVKVGTAIARRIGKTNTVPVRAGLKGEGVMSERQTGVGYDNWRLAELQESIGIKDHGVRLILEFGNRQSPADYAYLSNRNWCRNVAAKAVADGLEDVLGKLDGSGSGTTTTPTVPPVTKPPVTSGGEVAPGVTEEMAKKMFSDKPLPEFNKNGIISKTWLAECTKTGKWPKLATYLTGGSLDWYVFSDGSVINYEPKTGKVGYRGR